MTLDTDPKELTKIKRQVEKARDAVIALKAKRADINAQISEKIAGLESLGISRHAFRQALKYYESDPEQRAGYDLAYQIAREAMGLPVQGELFDDDGPAAAAAHVNGGEHEATIQ